MPIGVLAGEALQDLQGLGASMGGCPEHFQEGIYTVWLAGIIQGQFVLAAHAAAQTCMDHLVAFLRVAVHGDGFHQPAAVGPAIPRRAIQVFGVKAEGAVIAGTAVLQGQNILSAVITDKAFISSVV